jgi:hypothetical protein
MIFFDMTVIGETTDDAVRHLTKVQNNRAALSALVDKMHN